MSQRLFYLLGCLVLVGMNACKKTSEFREYSISDYTNFQDIHLITRLDDSVVVIGGKASDQGLIDWYRLDNEYDERYNRFPTTVQIITKFKDTYVAAIEGHRLFTKNLDGNFSEHFFQPKDWVSTEFKSEFRQFLNIGDSVLIAVSGSDLTFGTLIQSYDSLNTWAPLEVENELRCLAQNKNHLWAAGNGILIHTTIGDTVWKRVDLKNTAIAGLHFYDELNAIAITYRGQIIKSKDGGFNWSNPEGRKIAYVNKTFASDEVVYILGNNGLLGIYDLGAIVWMDLGIKADLKDGLIHENKLYIVTKQANLIVIELSALAE